MTFFDGGANDDWLVGGAGADTMIGGSNNDHFVFTSTSDAGDHITDFETDTNLTTLDTLDFQIGGSGFSIGNNNTTVDNFKSGNNTTINVAGTEVAVKTDVGLTTAQIQSTIDGYGNITTGALFVVFNSTVGHAQLYYDAEPSAAGGSTLLADMDNINTLAQLANYNASDFRFL